MKIRMAQSGDEKSIADVIIGTWKVAYRGILPDSFLDSLTTVKHEELFRKNIAERQETILVLENYEQDIVGIVSGGRDRSGSYDCELVAIYVLPNYQKQGFGKQLFKELIAAHKKNQYKSMIIWTFEDNKDRQFYDKLGGVVSRKNSHSFADNEFSLVGYTWQDINAIKIGRSAAH